METKIVNFEESKITFILTKDNGMMINATEMAKLFGKKVDNFTRTEQTQDFIKSCLKFANTEENKTPKSVLFGIKKEEDLIISSQKSGTFMHRVLALKFAAWLNSDFEVWVYSTIEQLLFGKHVERDKSYERTLILQKEIDELRDKPEKTVADFERYIEIEKALRIEKSIRKSLTMGTMADVRDLFSNQTNE